MLGKTFRAKFKKGRIEPREPVEFREDAELIVTAEEVAEGWKTPARDPWADYDPGRVRTVLRKFAGFLSEDEAERRIAAIYRAREEGSRPLS